MSDTQNQWSQSEGMELRDHFAGLAMQGQINNPIALSGNDACKLIANRAYRLADAMLAEREQQ
jgi:hypothetical protein